MFALVNARNALDYGRRPRVRFNQIALGVRRAVVWASALEAIPDHLEDEPTWPQTVTSDQS